MPVVILTSSREQQDMISGYGLSANSYVQKPVDFARFVQTVEQIKPYWLILNEFPQGVPENTKRTECPSASGSRTAVHGRLPYRTTARDSTLR